MSHGECALSALLARYAVCLNLAIQHQHNGNDQEAMAIYSQLVKNKSYQSPRWKPEWVSEQTVNLSRAPQTDTAETAGGVSRHECFLAGNSRAL